MPYFSFFPSIVVNGHEMPNFVLKAEIAKTIRSNPAFFQLYKVLPGETPEILAQNFYGDPTNAWVILLANDIISVDESWPLTEEELVSRCEEKYGKNHLFDVHHYETNGTGENSLPKGTIVERNFLPFEEIEEITNFAHEERANDLRRLVKIPRPALVDSIVAALRQAMLEVPDDSAPSSIPFPVSLSTGG